MKTLFGNSVYNHDKHSYVPTVLDQFETCLRDPVYWKLVKRVADNFIIFKKMLPMYTRDEFDFPGVKIDGVTTDKLITFMDDYDMDITNAVYLDDSEIKKQHSDYLFVARQKRLNHYPFKINIDIVSDKAVDSVVRIFIGPKYDCMGKLMKINDKRLDMVEIDTFVYKLQTGKNVIVRDSLDMHNIIKDRMWTRTMWDKSMMTDVMGMDKDTMLMTDNLWTDKTWYKMRLGFPRRLLLPMGRKGGLEMQLFVIVTPMQAGKTLNMVDTDAMRTRRTCRSTVCFDTLPLGFPFDRTIDVTKFYTNNMHFWDVMIFHENKNIANDVKGRFDNIDIMTHHDRVIVEKHNYIDSREI